MSDIEDTGPSDRPRVVACLMALKRLSEGKGLTGDYSTPARNPLAGFQGPQSHPTTLRLSATASLSRPRRRTFRSRAPWEGRGGPTRRPP